MKTMKPAAERFADCTKQDLLKALDLCAQQQPWHEMLLRAKINLLDLKCQQHLADADIILKRRAKLSLGVDRPKWLAARTDWQKSINNHDKLDKKLEQLRKELHP